MANEEPDGPGPAVSRRLGYLFKHAAARMDELGSEALAPFGIDPRELGILLVIASHEPGSQQQAAQRLGIDRTSMVSRLDALEGKGLVSRHPHDRDRRRNIVELTGAGRETVRRATDATERAEAALLDALPADERERFRAMLQVIVGQLTPEALGDDHGRHAGGRIPPAGKVPTRRRVP